MIAQVFDHVGIFDMIFNIQLKVSIDTDVYSLIKRRKYLQHIHTRS